MEEIVTRLRKSYGTGTTQGYEWRVKQLKAIERLLDENYAAVVDALKKDLSKPEQETGLVEIGVIKNSITYALKHLREWMQPVKEKPPLKVKPIYSLYTMYQPLGVVLIIGAWNYPLQLTLVPLVGALASGNCAILKPSELAPATAQLLEKLWSKYFDSEFVALVNGGIPETTDLLKQRFDHIFYTGNTMVGKIVMKAAANFMTPVTLECGGKSPCYVDQSANMTVSVKRILWGKYSNAGQTCIAPDYILCTKETQVYPY